MSIVPITLDSLTVNNLGVFNKITSPTEYPSSYLDKCRESGELCQYAYFSEVPVGVIVLDTIINKTPIALEISLIKVLKSYKLEFNVEKKLIQYALDLAPKRHLSSCIVQISSKDTQLINIFREMGFADDDIKKDIYCNVSSKGEDTILMTKALT